MKLISHAMMCKHEFLNMKNIYILINHNKFIIKKFYNWNIYNVL